jgi:hypothetical protein
MNAGTSLPQLSLQVYHHHIQVTRSERAQEEWVQVQEGQYPMQTAYPVTGVKNCLQSQHEAG